MEKVNGYISQEIQPSTTMIVKEKTILIIEDDPNIARSLTNALSKADYNPITLCSFKEAIEYIKEINQINAQNILGVIFDYSLGRDALTTSIPLVIMVKSIPNFKGILLANSSENFCNNHLLSVGCTHVQRGRVKTAAGMYMIQLLKE